MTKVIAKGGKYLRIVFDGNSSDQPVIANMVLECGEPVNIVFANTKDIDGKAYGHMIIQIPDDPVIYHKITLYLDLEKITYAEENYDV